MTHRIELVAQDRLLSRRRTLQTLVERASEADSNRLDEPKDEVDRADELERSSLLQTLTDRERRELQDIDDALERLTRGTYGRCEQCGGPVGHQRLAALPEARFCVSCSTAHAPA